METRIIIADDHLLFADGLSTIIRQEDGFTISAIVSNGEELLKFISVSPPHLVLLDVSMPGMNGLSAAERIVDLYPEVKILMVTMNDSVDIIKSLIQTGVHGIILKNTGKAELLLAISEVIKGNSYFSQKITQHLARDHKAKKEEWQLTRREKEVLHLIYEGLSTSEIAERLFISSYTVETHRKNLLLKSGLNKSSQLVKQALELGYIKKDQI